MKPEKQNQIHFNALLIQVIAKNPTNPDEASLKILTSALTAHQKQQHMFPTKVLQNKHEIGHTPSQQYSWKNTYLISFNGLSS